MALPRIVDRIQFQILGKRDNNRKIVFGVGLSKTGTSSVAKAMEILGFNSIHYPPIAKFTNESCSLVWPWWMEKYNFANDLPVAATYRLLHERFPKAAFILTVRDVDTWLESCRKHFTPERTRGFSNNPDLEPARQLYLHMYGRTTFDKKTFASAYKRHVDGVVDFFANRKQITILDVADGDGWTELCTAVSKPVPDVPFPKRNVRSVIGAKPIDLV